jgi:hypothetical protein
MRKSGAHVATSSCLLAASLVACFGNASSGAPSSPLADAASVDDGGATADATAAAEGTFDAAPGCNVLSDQTRLSATDAGLPATGLVLWLRADRGVYTAAADAGTDSGVAGPPVCAWVDQSGSGWALANLTSTQPNWVASAIGGQPAVHFSGALEALQAPGVLGIAAASPRTFVAVEELVNGDGRFEPIVQGETGSVGTYIAIDANTWDTAGNREGVYMTSNSYDTNTPTTTTAARVHVYTVTSMTPGAEIVAAVDYRVNGVTQTLTHLPGGSDDMFQDFSSANFTAVGDTFSSSTGAAADGLVAEVLVYDRALSVAERASVESALRSRYAIQ